MVWACPSICLSVSYACNRSRTVRDRILNLVCRTSMKIKETCIFFLVHQICHCRVIALFKVFHFHYIVSLWKLVNKIFQEPLEPG